MTKSRKTIESANAVYQQVVIETSSDAVASLQIGKYEDMGTDGKVLHHGYEVTLVAKDESLPQPQSVVVTFTPDQARNMAKSLLSMANSVYVKNAKLQGAKFPF